MRENQPTSEIIVPVDMDEGTRRLLEAATRKVSADAAQIIADEIKRAQADA